MGKPDDITGWVCFFGNNKRTLFGGNEGENYRELDWGIENLNNWLIFKLFNIF